MDKVVTLPITLGPKRSFLTLVTPFVADLITRASGRELAVMLNTVGMKSDEVGVSSSEQYGQYADRLSTLGVDARIEHDGSPEYEAYFQKLWNRISQEGLIFQSRTQIAWCACGRVEIPVSVLEALLREQRKKSLVRGNDMASAVCIKCGSTLRQEQQDVLALGLSYILPAALPRFYTGELKAVVERVSERPLYISRNHRRTELDTDFRWMGYLGFLCEPGDRVMVVTSPTTLNQSIKVVAFSRLLFPEIHVELLIHPLVSVKDKRINVAGMDIEEFLGFADSATVARMFLSLGLQWTFSRSVVDSSEMYFLRRTLEHPLPPRTPLDPITAAAFVEVFTRPNISGLYKSIRAGRFLTKQQNLVYNSVVPSD